MTRTLRPALLALLLGLALLAPSLRAQAKDIAHGKATASLYERPESADGKNWPGFGRSYSAQHFSPLKRIGTGNVGKLGLAWSADLDVPWSVSAPIAVDGVLYTAVGDSIVHAFEAKTGKLLWKYDPEVATHAGERLRGPIWGIRGLAYWQGRVFVGTKDGRLIALDAKAGTLVWSVMTLEKDQRSATISGPPTVFNGKIVIGFGGADVGTTRGYVTAYDTQTGKQLWRFYLVPGNPAKGFENKAMEMAAKTWTGEWWKLGGGGAAWNAITYDPEFNRVYIGTGNGGPWNQKVRSPGGGDNLFLCSVLALDADTGAYVWHYQTTPGETWDFNSTMDIELATLTIDGKPRKVLLHAPKNGFFYVIDRETGKLISAEKFTKVTWAERVDLTTGRPIETANARYQNGPVKIYPSSVGAHNWLPMSFNPMTGLVYIPETEFPGYYDDSGVDLKGWRPKPGVHSATGLSSFNADVPAAYGKSSLVAWDPVAQKPRWTIPLPGYWNGGTLTTASKLVFQGRIDGHFVAYDARSGKELWTFFAGAPVTAPPITYMVDGTQYVTVLTGVSGGGTLGSAAAQFGWDFRTYPRKVLTFALNGNPAPLPRPPIAHVQAFDDPDFKPDPARATKGSDLYLDLSCIACHGPGAVSGGSAPDLRGSAVIAAPEAFEQIVREGVLKARGMPQYPELSDAELATLRHYIRSRAADLRRGE